MLATFEMYDLVVSALTAWREARGEGCIGMLAVLSVVRNRAKLENRSPSQICTKKWQFSSLTAPGDPMLLQWPEPNDQQFLYCLSIVGDVFDGNLSDPTQGATHYFNPKIVMPDWATGMTKVATIGHHDFYKATAKPTATG